MVTYTFVNGTTADANEVNQNFTDNSNVSTKLSKNAMMAIWNTDYAGWETEMGFSYTTNAGAQNFNNLKSDTFVNTDDLSASINTIGQNAVNGATYAFHDTYKDIILAGKLYDDCTGVTPDADLWGTTGTLTYGASDNYVQASGAPTCALQCQKEDETSGMALVQDNSQVAFYWYTFSDCGDNRNHHYNIWLKDSDENLVVIEYADTGGSIRSTWTNSGIAMLQFFDNDGTPSVRYYKNGAYVSTIDISSLTGDRIFPCIQGEADSGNDTTTNRMGPVLYTNNTDITGDACIYESLATTSSETITNAVVMSNGPSEAWTWYLSADNGANFEEVTLDELHKFTNTGTQLITRAVASGVVAYMPAISEVGVVYNV